MLCVTIGLGLYERQQAVNLGRLAINVYEQSLMSISYVRGAQVGFMRFAAALQKTPHGNDVWASAQQRAAGLKDVLDDLDVALERIVTAEAGKQARELRARMAPRDGGAPNSATGGAEAEYAGIDQGFDTLTETLTADAFTQRSDADAMIAASERSIRLALGVSIAVALLITMLLGTGIVRPVRRAVTIADAIAEGRLDNVIQTKGRSETARLLLALARMQTALTDANAGRAAHEVADAERRAAFEQRLTGALRGMADTVETEAAMALDQISSRTRAMAGNAEDMRRSALDTDASSREAAGAAERCLETSQTVASAAEELSVSIREISERVVQSTQVVGRAVAASGETRGKIEALNNSVAQISAITNMINEIAGRTNLLALNATIEAARAGDAGKGFAVVAGEVKQLAIQTARSTARIGEFIQEVRTATAGSIEAVMVIEQMISEIDAISTMIASAVEQQGAATQEIARNVAETAQAAGVVNERITRVSAEAGLTGQRAQDVGDLAGGLAAAVGELKRAVVRTVRTSTSEVDRRVHQRHAIDLGCRLAVESNGSQAGRLADVSEGGVQVLNMSGLEAGVRGVLTLDGATMTLPATVHWVDEDSARLIFDLDETQQEEWRRTLERLIMREAA